MRALILIICPPLPHTVLKTSLACAREMNEVFLWHGAPIETIPKIVQNGFDLRFSRDAGLYGKGIYFSAHASKSDMYVRTSSDNLCSIMLARVHLGKYAKAQTERRGSKFAPTRRHSRIND